MHNWKFIIIKKWQEWTIWNSWLWYCTLKNIPMIRIYVKTKYSSIIWDYMSIEKEKLILDKNCQEIQDFFMSLWKKYQVEFNTSCYNCTFSRVNNEFAEEIAIEIYDFLHNLIKK